MSRTTHRLPENLNPTGDICVPLFIPDDIQWKRYVTRAIRTLTMDRHWDRDEVSGANTLAVRKRWEQSTYYPLIDALQDETPCSKDEESENCFNMGTKTEAFTYYPNDPFASNFYSQSDDSIVLAFGMQWNRFEDTDIENHPAFQYLEDLVSSALGYYPNDILVFPNSLGEFAFLNLAELVSLVTFQQFPFPYVKYEFIGSGSADVKLVNFPLGCSVLLIPDMELTYSGLLESIINIIDGGGTTPADWVWTEVNRDITAFPPETAATQGQEINFPDEGNHNLHVIFIPRLNDEVPFLFPFGGIREIQVCGDLKVVGSQSGEQIDYLNVGLHSNREGYIEATMDDFYDALIRYETEKANRWLFATDSSNIVSGVEIDPDTGLVTVKESGGGQGEVIEALAQEVHYGGATNQAIQFKKLLDELNANITSGYSVLTLVNLSRIITNPLDVVAWSDLVTEYNTANPQVTIGVTDLALSLFCADSYEGVLNYAIAEHSASEEDLNFIVRFAQEIPPSTWSKWYESGKTTPKLGFTSASCYRQPSITGSVDYTEYSTTVNGIVIFPQNTLGNRKWRVATGGKFIDATGREYDGVFLRDGNTLTRNQIKLGKSLAAASNATNNPLYSDLNKYGLEFSPTVAVDMVSFPQAFTPVSGSITFILYDLGAQ